MSDRPFIGSTAVTNGAATPHELRTRYRSLYRNVYISPEAELTALARAEAAWLWARGEAILAGISAAAVHRTKWLDARRPAELIRADRHAPVGITIHTWSLLPDEHQWIRGMRVTTPARTAYDLGRNIPGRQSIPILDALLNATGVEPDQILTIADANPGARGVRRLRSTLSKVDGGAESPPESRLRLLLTEAGLPPPETQIEFRDAFGNVRIRVDMGWRTWRVAVEYDGQQHWTDPRQRAWDIERIAALEELGWVVVRVSADMMSRPRSIVERVRAKLRAAGCPLSSC